jgi:PPOX class probable F420-dependent enzyme
MIEPDSRAGQRLQTDLIGWLTTVTPGGTPQTSPVWFLWNGTEFLVYSVDGARTRNVATNPRVSLNLDGNGLGGDIVTLEGTARIDQDAPSAAHRPDYLAKYQERMDSYGWSAEKFAADYPVAIRISPTRIRSW